MLPYFGYTQINLGFINLHIWGIFAALGFGAGLILTYWFLRKNKFDTDKFWDLAIWTIIGALIGARLFHVFLYEPAYYTVHWLDIFKIWQGGLSSLGGIFGAGLAATLYLKKSKLPILAYFDALAFSIPFGLFFGRIACVLINEHPGLKSDFFLATAYPDGSRLDLGFLLLLNNLILSLIFLYFAKQARPVGFYVIFFSFWYGVGRFFLDFLRAWDLPGADIRYFYLTPAQYGCLFLLLMGILISKKTKLLTFKR